MGFSKMRICDGGLRVIFVIMIGQLAWWTASAVRRRQCQGWVARLAPTCSCQTLSQCRTSVWVAVSTPRWTTQCPAPTIASRMGRGMQPAVEGDVEEVVEEVLMAGLKSILKNSVPCKLTVC